MKSITLLDAKELMDESSDKYSFVKDIAGESGRWSCYHQVVFYDPREESNTVNKKEGTTHDLYAFSYEEGLTEMQESTIDTEDNYELSLYDTGHDTEKVPVYPVKKVVKQVVDYVQVGTIG